MSFLVDPDDLVASVFATVLRPPPPPDLNAWAEENIAFGRESPFPGRYSRKTLPLAERILEVLGPDHPARVVTLMGSAQVVKTTIGQIFVAGCMDLDPCDMLYVHPSHDNALRWARGKWRQMRNQSDALKRVFGGEKSRDGTDMPDTVLSPGVLATIESEQYHQRPVTLSRAYFNPATRALLSVERVLRGYVDQMRHAEKPGGEATLSCLIETRARDVTRRGYRVRSDADQKQLAAADGSLRHAATAPNDDFYWGRLPGQVKK